MSRLVDIVGLGIVTLLCCVPLFTVGAAFSALYYVTLKMVRREDDGIYRQYFRAFRQNFLKGTALWLIMAAIIAILYVDYSLLVTQDISYKSLEWILLIIISVVLALVFCYVFPLQAQFENPVGRTLKNSLLLCIMNLPRSILILGVKLAPVVVLIFYPNLLYLLAIFCIAGLPYLCTELFVKIFDKYIPKAEEPAEELSGNQSEAEPIVPTPVFSSPEDDLAEADPDEPVEAIEE